MQVCECACTSPEKTGLLELFIPRLGGEFLTGHSCLETNIDEHNYSEFKKIQVNAVTLDKLLSENNINSIDLLSVDVEGSELDVLRGIDLKNIKPTLILIEDKHLYLVKHRYLVRHGYVLAQRHNRNCWYIRAGSPLPRVSLIERFKLWKRMYISIWIKKIKYSVRHKTIKPFLIL